MAMIEKEMVIVSMESGSIQCKDISHEEYNSIIKQLQKEGLVFLQLRDRWIQIRKIVDVYFKKYKENDFKDE